MTLIIHWTTQMASKNKLFYQQMGQRIALFRKAQELTQQQLAKILNISQQTLAHYEVGRLRVAVAMLPLLANALSVSVEELIEEQTAAAPSKRGPIPKLQKQIEQVSLLPRTKQKFVMDMLDTVINQQSAG